MATARDYARTKYDRNGTKKNEDKHREILEEVPLLRAAANQYRGSWRLRYYDRTKQAMQYVILDCLKVQPTARK